jgi:hypothetical protein
VWLVEGGETNVVSDMSYVSLFVVARARDHVGKVPLVNLDVYVEGRAKSRNLHVVTICATFCHSLEMVLESVVYVGPGGSSSNGREGANILSLGIPPCAASGLGVYELFVIVGMFSHVGNNFGTYDVVFFLVAVQLVTKCVEQAVSWLD